MPILFRDIAVRYCIKLCPYDFKCTVQICTLVEELYIMTIRAKNPRYSATYQKSTIALQQETFADNNSVPQVLRTVIKAFIKYFNNNTFNSSPTWEICWITQLVLLSTEWREFEWLNPLSFETPKLGQMLLMLFSCLL